VSAVCFKFPVSEPYPVDLVRTDFVLVALRMPLLYVGAALFMMHILATPVVLKESVVEYFALIRNF
jgi:hypothetical protein